MRILTLRLRKKWWHQIKAGEKICEMRLATDRWRKRLSGHSYDEVHLWLGYPKKTETDKRLICEWKGIALEIVLHEEFGPKPVEVFVISLGRPRQ